MKIEEENEWIQMNDLNVGDIFSIDEEDNHGEPCYCMVLNKENLIELSIDRYGSRIEMMEDDIPIVVLESGKIEFAKSDECVRKVNAKLVV